MIDYDRLFNTGPFSFGHTEKMQLLTAHLSKLTRHHYNNCLHYKRMLDAINFDVEAPLATYEDLPFLPVSLFKSLDLMSIPRDEIFKTLYSSGTSGQSVSKIYLNKKTAALQQKALIKTVSEFTGLSRCPMLIIDSPKVLNDRNSFSARGAAILGFSLFGNERCFALDDNLQLNLEAVLEFVEMHSGEKIFVFGFTFIVWHYFYQQLKKLSQHLNLSNAILIHGGGWKKLSIDSISNAAFKEVSNRVCGIKSIHDYYGMVEQTGSIYLECSNGNLHTSIFGDIITRRPNDFSVCDMGEEGLVQVLSVLPLSYCGHSLLTEDLGILLGDDGCPCGRLGKYFRIHGRIQNTEIRGCSDAYGR